MIPASTSFREDCGEFMFAVDMCFLCIDIAKFSCSFSPWEGHCFIGHAPHAHMSNTFPSILRH